jgi:uncharacterized glyoxalase superfamily protein PhnB
MGDETAIDDKDNEGAGRMPDRLTMVVLGARHLPSLRTFYRALGWSEQEGASDNLSTFQLGDVALALYPAPPESGVAADVRSAVTLVLPVGNREEVDQAWATALRVGAQPVVAPQDQPWGGRSGIIADPEGNRWEVLWVPNRSVVTGPAVGHDI